MTEISVGLFLSIKTSGFIIFGREVSTSWNPQIALVKQ